MSLLFFSLPRHPWESGVTSLVLGSLSPPRMLISPSQIVPSLITVEEHHYPIHWRTGTCTPPRPYFVQSPLPHSAPGAIFGCGPTSSPKTVAQSYSQPDDSESTSCCQFHGKTQCFSTDSWFGSWTLDACSGVSCWILEVPHYYGSHTGCQFLLWECISIVNWAHVIEDTSSQLWCLYLFIYFLQLIDRGIQIDTHRLLIHW